MDDLKLELRYIQSTHWINYFTLFHDMMICVIFSENQRDSETYVKNTLDETLFKKMQAIEARRQKEQHAEKQAEKLSKSEKRKIQKEKHTKLKVSYWTLKKFKSEFE